MNKDKSTELCRRVNGHNFTPIWSPRSTRPEHVCFTSVSPSEVFTHWTGEKTDVCNRGFCQWCSRGHNYRTRYYASGLVGPRKRHVIIELTPCAMAGVLRSASFDDLRGEVFALFRSTEKRNSRIDVEYCERVDFGQLPAPKSVQTIVPKIFGFLDATVEDLNDEHVDARRAYRKVGE